MTREEFIENVTCWSDLISFCDNEGCSYCEDIYDEYAKDEYFDDCIVDMARNADGWADLYRELDEIPTGYDYYISDDYGWHGADDDDFDEYKSDVLSWGDDREVWDEEEEDEFDELLDEEDEIDEAHEEDEDDEVELEEGCSLGELFTSSATKLQTIEIEAEKEREREEKFFEQFLASAT